MERDWERSRQIAKLDVALAYGAVNSWSISNVDEICAVGRKDAATLQYFVSDSSIACLTDFSDTLRP